MRRRRDGVDQLADVGHATDRLELVPSPQLLRQGEGVHRLVPVRQEADDVEDLPVRLQVEVVPVQHLQDALDGGAAVKRRAQRSLLRLQGLGRKLVGESSSRKHGKISSICN